MGIKRKSLSQLFHEVDPGLTVIPGGSYHHSADKAVFSEYGLHRMTDEDWDRAAGVECRHCHREVHQLVDGLCLPCVNNKALKTTEELERKTMKAYYTRALREGRVTLTEMRKGKLERLGP